MSTGKSKGAEVKAGNAAKSAGKTPPAAVPTVTPPLFRAIDWWTFAITTLLVFVGYFLTLAPDLGLEDSGELAVGSYYAGIPHPPGYPVWTLYTWLFSHLVPISNIAYRVALASALAGAFSCGLLALIVSRGSSMMIEGISNLKNMDRRWETGICMVAGFAAGILIGFNGYMWSQSVIVEVYSFSMVSMTAMLVCFLRWIYAPHQRRYLYIALFLFGICVTNHQTLLLAAMGIEAIIIAGQPKLGRDFLLGNSIVYITGLILKQQQILTGMDGNPSIFILFNCVGILSIIGCGWLAIQTRQLATEWKVVLICGVLWVAGAALYLWMPIAGMSTPPMQWGYPRTVEGFFHALSRGQYEKTNPADVLNNPFAYVKQLGILFGGVVGEFNLVFALIALVPFFFFLRMQRRERAWIIGLFGIYCCVGFFLLALINPSGDRQSLEVGRVQFTASHFIVAIFAGYGIALILALMAAHYDRFRWPWGIVGGLVASAFALYTLADTIDNTYGSGPANFFTAIAGAFAKDRYTLPIIAGLLLLALTVIYTLSLLLSRKKAMMSLALGIFAVMPSYSVLTHWFENEQRGHLFGFWFGHDMFTPPFDIYPEMARDTVLYGGTDPGRFCPTYMIFAESMIPASKKRDPKFDRRDVYIITQNALADGTYLMYIRSHYNKSSQVKLGLDTPFFQELVRGRKERDLGYKTNLVARMVQPLDRFFTSVGDRIERERRVGNSLFTEEHFTDLSGLAAKLKKGEDPVSSFVFKNLSPGTQSLLAGGNDSRLRASLVKDLNRLLEQEVLDRKRLAGLRAEKDALSPESSEKDRRRKEVVDKEIDALYQNSPLYDAERFRSFKLSETTRKFIAQDPQSHTRIRLNRLLLEEVYPREIAKSLGGVYPDREIYIATPEDSARSFNEYMEDAKRRLEQGQLDPGENVTTVGNRVQVSGQVAVMAINGLITKVIFDRNPDHEFYVEESFPLKWMYPHLTPFGIIMKINREPLAELAEETLQKDHEFWSRYSERFIGNWITYDTPVKEICDWVEKVYLRRDFNGFKGDRKFIRDDQAQKAFSKLRSAIAGVYAWRVNASKNSAEQQRMITECEFAFKQAFAFCPYSPEAVFRYAQLLAGLGRFDDALHVAYTCQKLDPDNGSVVGLIKNLTEGKNITGAASNQRTTLNQLESQHHANPSDFDAAFRLASAYSQLQQTNAAVEILEKVMNNPKAGSGELLVLAQGFAQMGIFQKLELVLEKLVKVSPDSVEAWYDLSAMKAFFSKNAESLHALSNAFVANDRRLAKDPAAQNLRTEVIKDIRFNSLRGNPEFEKLMSGK